LVALYYAATVEGEKLVKQTSTVKIPSEMTAEAKELLDLLSYIASNMLN